MDIRRALTPVEEEVAAAVRSGSRVSLLGRGSDGQRIGADLVRSLCVGSVVDATTGIDLTGVVIDGYVDLGSISSLPSLTLNKCELRGSPEDGELIGLTLARSSGSQIVLDDCTVMGAIRGEGLQLQHSLVVSQTTVGGNVNLPGVKVGSNLAISDPNFAGWVMIPNATVGANVSILGGNVAGQDGYSILADSLRVAGSVAIGFNGSERLRLEGTASFRGAQVDGGLHLVGVELTSPAVALDLRDTRVGGNADLRSRAAVTRVQGRVHLDGAAIGGALDMTMLELTGRLTLDNARVAGRLDLDGAQLAGTDGVALVGQGLEVGGGLSAVVENDRAFSSKGLIHLAGARVDGDFIMRGVSLSASVSPCLLADRMVVRGAFILGSSGDRRSECHGAVSLRGAQIEGDVDLSGASIALIGVDRFALTCERITVAGAFLAMGPDHPLEVKQQVSLRSAAIGRDLDLSCAELFSLTLVDARIGGNVRLDGVTLRDTGDLALLAERIDVKGGVYLNEVAGRAFTSAGGVRLGASDIGNTLEVVGARIDGQLSINNSMIARDVLIMGAELRGDPTSLFATRVEVGGSMFLRCGSDSPLKARGMVDLMNARITGSLDLSGSRLECEQRAFAGERLSVGGNLLMRQEGENPFLARGAVLLEGAQVGGRLEVAPVGPVAALDVRNAACGSYGDTEGGWPPYGSLKLAGFRITNLDQGRSVSSYLRWVQLQGLDLWSPAPYEEIAAGFARTGNEHAKREMQIAKHKDELRHLRYTSRWKLWSYRCRRRAVGALVAYGYKPLRAFWLLVAAIGVSAALFGGIKDNGAMSPNRGPDHAKTCGEDYPCFNPIVYSADVALPIVNFGQEDVWSPNSRAPWGTAAQALRWILIVVGWALASLLIAALTGIVRRE